MLCDGVSNAKTSWQPTRNSCDRLLLDHLANVITLTFVFVSHKIFWWGCFGAPLACFAWGQLPPLHTPLVLLYATGGRTPELAGHTTGGCEYNWILSPTTTHRSVSDMRVAVSLEKQAQPYATLLGISLRYQQTHLLTYRNNKKKKDNKYTATLTGVHVAASPWE